MLLIAYYSDDDPTWAPSKDEKEKEKQVNGKENAIKNSTDLLKKMQQSFAGVGSAKGSPMSAKPQPTPPPAKEEKVKKKRGRPKKAETETPSSPPNGSPDKKRKKKSGGKGGKKPEGDKDVNENDRHGHLIHLIFFVIVTVFLRGQVRLLIIGLVTRPGKIVAVEFATRLPRTPNWTRSIYRKKPTGSKVPEEPTSTTFAKYVKSASTDTTPSSTT